MMTGSESLFARLFGRFIGKDKDSGAKTSERTEKENAGPQPDEMGKMFIIAGLGNPGRKYEKTRHNCGFEALDVLADRYRIDVSQDKFKARIGRSDSIGLAPAIAFALSILSFSMTRGMMRVPASLSPFFISNPFTKNFSYYFFSYYGY